ncbi:unnamed protein product [Clavelina lepadiformis]|uniref:Uncharacterized protein n=1 Tax=Clavelina lepadiformis TaxID=159417 RepID=A0ABP0FAW8_CLALP
MSKTSVASITKKTEEKPVLKNSLLQPYIVTWPQLQKGTTPSILSELTRLFESHPEIKKLKSAGKRKLKADFPKQEVTANLRSDILVGIREVTKALEKDQISLLLVCRSAKPALLTQPLIHLVATRSVPAACISDLSTTVAPLLGLKTALALGFRRDLNLPDFSQVVDAIESRLSPITLPWIKKPITSEQPLPNTGEAQRSVNSISDTCFIPTKICINRSVAGKKKRKKQK